MWKSEPIIARDELLLLLDDIRRIACSMENLQRIAEALEKNEAKDAVLLKMLKYMNEQEEKKR